MGKHGRMMAIGLIAWLVTAMTVTLVTGIYSYFEVRDRFSDESERAAFSFAGQLRDLERATNSAVLFLSAGAEASGADFSIIARDTLSRSPFLDGIAYFPRVTAANIGLLTQYLQAQGMTEFKVRDWVTRQLLDGPIGDNSFPLLYAEPDGSWLGAFRGADAARSAQLSPAITRAVESGRGVLVSGDLSGKGGEYWLVRALYSGRRLPLDSSDGWARAVGLVAMRFAPDRLFDKTQTPWLSRYLIRADGGAGALLIARGEAADGFVVRQIARRMVLGLGRDHLELRFVRPVILAEVAELGIELSLTAGLLPGFLAMLLAGARWERNRAQRELQRNRDQLEELVFQRTRELQETNQALAEEIAERKKAQQELQQLAIRDPLTGVYNRREMERQLEEEIARSLRYGHPLAVLMADIDHFKAINDSYGHRVGDCVVRCVAARLEHTVRRSDRVARYGGEEFLVIMPDTGLGPALALAERIRSELAEYPMAEQGGRAIRVTISIGVAAFPEHGPDAAALCEHADRALYRAKAAGRDRVERA